MTYHVISSDQLNYTMIEDRLTTVILVIIVHTRIYFNKLFFCKALPDHFVTGFR
jgi:hypothetical protein